MKQNIEMGYRHRAKRKFANVIYFFSISFLFFHFTIQDGEGGCTLTHDEKGDVINTTIVNEEPSKPKVYIKKPTIRLIYCRPFPDGVSYFDFDSDQEIFK